MKSTFTKEDLDLFTDEELQIQIANTDARVTLLHANLLALRREQLARKFGIRIGDEIVVDSKRYRCCGLDNYNYYVSFTAMTKSGEWSNNVRYAYHWEEYKAGSRLDPW